MSKLTNESPFPITRPWSRVHNEPIITSGDYRIVRNHSHAFGTGFKLYHQGKLIAENVTQMNCKIAAEKHAHGFDPVVLFYVVKR